MQTRKYRWRSGVDLLSAPTSQSIIGYLRLLPMVVSTNMAVCSAAEQRQGAFIPAI